jgi:uroporphyrinogen decarboxylase
LFFDVGSLLAKWEKPCSALEVDWTCSLRNARYLLWKYYFYKGNFDPSRLLSLIPVIKKMVHEMIDEFRRQMNEFRSRYFTNIPVDHAKAFIDAVKNVRQGQYLLNKK